ncbi:MAG: hypothetical protein GXN95_01065 [Methanococci archaeon]|nr:hypothetical protein [Methanococci archaeon]
MEIFKLLRKDEKMLYLMFIGMVMFLFIFIPFLKFKMVGSDHTINAYPSLSAVCGLLLGPIYGFLAIFLVDLTYFILNPKAFYFGIYSLIPPILSVISAGALCEGKWKYSALILIVGLILFYSTDVGREVFYHPFLTILALILILLFRDKVSKMLFSKNFEEVVVGATVLSFSSVMVDHLYGSILGIVYLHIPAKDYIAVIPEFIKERIIMTIIGAFFVILMIETSKCFLKNAKELREKLLRSYIDEEVKYRSTQTSNINRELLEKYNVRIPSEDEQKEILKSIVEVMMVNNKKGED